MESTTKLSDLIIQVVDARRIALSNFKAITFRKDGDQPDMKVDRNPGKSASFSNNQDQLRKKRPAPLNPKLDYALGQAHLFGLEAGEAYWIRISASGYETQEREIVLQAGSNTMLFIMGEVGSQYYRQNGVYVPFHANQEHFVVLEEPSKKVEIEEFSKLIAKHKSFSVFSMLEAQRATLNKAQKKRLEKQNPVKPWHPGFIRAELKLIEKGNNRRAVLKKLHHAMQKKPGVGRLAVVVHESEKGASMYAGEIILTLNQGLSQKQMKGLCSEYGLVFLRSEGWDYHFAVVDGPDLDFNNLLDRILAERPEVVASEPVLEAVQELDIRVVPQDFLYAMQWDHHIIQIPEAWGDLQVNGGGPANQYGSNSIVIAVADTNGIEIAHQDLNSNVNGLPKILASYDFNGLGPLTPAVLTGTHGTCCAGAATANADIISATNPAFWEGTAGSAPGCRLVAVKAGVGNEAQMYNWYIGLRVPNPAAQLGTPVDVTSNSYGNPAVILATEIRFLDFASDFGRLGRGIVMCYSAGNFNTNILGQRPLAAYPRTICVTAATLSSNGTIENRAVYSNFGPEADVCSPSDNRIPAVSGNVLHAPPSNYGAVTCTVTNAIANPMGFWDGNLPGAPGLSGGVTISDTIAAVTLAASPRLTLNTSNVPFAAVTSVLVDGVNSPNVEGLQVTGLPAAPPNSLNIRYDINFANTQQRHNAGVTVQGGSGDYSSSFGGTSHSTPVTSGVIALMLSAKPTLSWVEIRLLLRNTARKVNPGETGAGGVGQWIDPSLTAPNNTVLNGAQNNVRPKNPAVSTTLAANANKPGDPLPHKNHGSSVIRVASVAGFEVGDAIRIKKGATQEFRVVEAINAGTNELTIDALVNNYTTAGAGTTIVAGGVKPVFSQYYGFGRINAAKAVIAARTYNHADRDLVIRNTLSDTGLVDIVAPAIQIQSPDIWIRNQADPPLPAPAYDQDGPHQNPVAATNRFIYARIKNIGTQKSNLDAWVHFYVALSDHTAPLVDPNANPTNITTPFLFPGDFNSATAAITQKSWCDDANNDITLPAPNGIISNNQKVYHVLDTTVVNVPNQLIPAATVAQADPNNINTGVTVVRVQWNAVDLPPVATPFGIYLLAYVSPVDGARQGHEAGRNNNMSFREIAFADFNLLDSFGLPGLPLASSVNVDAFGTPVTTVFNMRVQQSIGLMPTELVMIEISRTSDNGSVERGFFRNTGGVWQLEDSLGNPGTIAWAAFNIPMLFGTGNPAIGNQTDINFGGSFGCGMQHHKISLRAVIHSARPGAVLVPVAEQSFDVRVIAAIPEISSASTTDPAPPVPDSYVFTDFATLITQPSAAKSFGPIDSGHFRITSVFTAASAPKAYALCAGAVMVQVVDANRVNLILRPLRQAGLGMTPVKYYIYRGLRKDDFFNAANTEVRPVAGAKDFIARIWPVFVAQNPAATPFPAAALGWDPPNQTPATKIDQYFFATGATFQYSLVKAGEYMADFYHTGASEFGFEIVLEEGTAQPTIANVQLSEYIIDVSALPDANDTQKFTKRLAREEVLNYMDPAAFYGMHYAGTVRQKPAGTWTGQDIVVNVVDKFFTKRKVYIDIRNENGDSYNFYQNYKGQLPAVDYEKNIKFGDISGLFATENYGSSEWPVHIVTVAHPTADPMNPLVLQLRWDDNIKPVLYVEHGTITSANINNRFVDENQLFVQPAPYAQTWTNDISFTSPNTGGGASKDSIAWVFKLHYGRMINATTVWRSTVVKTEKTTDNLFGPIDLEAPWGALTNTRWIAAQDRKYVDGQLLGFGQMMERGVAYEGDATTGRVIFYAALLDQHLNPIAGFTPRRGITGGVSDAVSFLQAARSFDQYRLQFGSVLDGATPVTTLKFVPGAVVNAGSANGVMFLGITAAQLTALKGLAGLNNNYPRTIAFEEVGPVGTGKKYKIGVQGLQPDGTCFKVMPTAGNEIFLYSMEGLFYYSDAFSTDEPLPTTYVRNVEEAVGAMNLPLVGPVNYLINGKNHGANGNFRVAGNLLQLISKGGQFQITGNPDNSGTYIVNEVTYASASNITTLKVSNVPGNSTSGSLQLLPRTIEEHFINLDPFIVISGIAAMKTIVDGFELQVNGVPNDQTSVAALQNHIDNFGPMLLNRARAAVRNSVHANPDDRPLYWSRLKMMVILKSHEFLLQNVAEAATLVKRLDDRTRGIIPVPNFGGAGANKKALVVGFDPFSLVPGQAYHNSHQSNPSGVAALFLHNATEIPGMFIQSVIVPVRFEDFDAGLIDNLVDTYLNGAAAVDMILSVSQDIDLRFHVDRFGTRFRSTTVPDNLGISGKLAVHYELDAAHTELIRLASNANMPQFLETTLPASIMAPGHAMPVAASGTQIVKTVIFDQKFTPLGSAEQGVDNISTFSGISPAAGVEVEKGSGGNYLSNELFYRIAWRRTQRASTINTGHLHVPKLQQGSPPDLSALFDQAMFKYFVDTMIQILKDALPGI